MVNASLNWASIVGIVLAVGGAMLYFMRSFKPALARDYDVFFAAIGLLCGGILFFQGWRLDPILQFGQFLLAGTTVFFAYESVRLRGVSAEQARRSASMTSLRRGHPLEACVATTTATTASMNQPVRRRFAAQDFDEAEGPEQDFYRRVTASGRHPEGASRGGARCRIGLGCVRAGPSHGAIRQSRRRAFTLESQLRRPPHTR